MLIYTPINKNIISLVLFKNVETALPKFIEILLKFSTNQHSWCCSYAVELLCLSAANTTYNIKGVLAA